MITLDSLEQHVIMFCVIREQRDIVLSWITVINRVYTFLGEGKEGFEGIHEVLQSNL